MLPQHPHNAGLFCCVVGERRGWRGVGGETQINYKVNIFHLDSIDSTFGPRPQVSGYFFKTKILSPFYVRPHVNGVFGHHEKQVFENGP